MELYYSFRNVNKSLLDFNISFGLLMQLVDNNKNRKYLKDKAGELHLLSAALGSV